MTNKKIGVFDSGFGGLTILRGLVDRLPDYEYVYLGDNARAPYGDKEKDEIHNFTLESAKFLIEKDCELIILACNTASADALRQIQQKHQQVNHPDKRVLGVLIPAAEEAAKITKNKKVGIIATEGTVKSEAFLREVRKIDSEIEIFQKACPELVERVEAGKHLDPESVDILRSYLTPLLQQGVDTLILGCTHFSALKDEIAKIAGEEVALVKEENVVADRLVDYLKRHPEIEEKLVKSPSITFYTTGETGKFESLAGNFYGKEVVVEQVSL